MIYTEDQARAAVIEAGHRLLEEKLVARTWGNISAKISETEFLITPSGRAYDTLQPEDLVVVSIEDCSWTGERKPSSEKHIHAMAYRQRPQAGFIIHTHQFYASAVGAEGKDKPYAPCAAHAAPGTEQLKKNLEKVMVRYPEHNSFLMEKHGAICIGTDSEEAFAEAAALERNCKTTFDARVALSEPGELPSKLPAKAENAHAFTDAFVASYCRLGKPLQPWIDDFAMIIGTQAAITDSTLPTIEKGIRGRGGVLLYRGAAVTTGNTREDAEAAAAILSKNCAAALYVKKGRPLNAAIAALERAIYLAKYSKKRDEE